MLREEYCYYWINMFYYVLQISEYLYPCVIEYSLIALTIFYILWASIKSRYKSENKYGSYDINPNKSRRDSAVQTFVRRHSLEAYNRINNLMKEKPEVNKFTIGNFLLF